MCRSTREATSIGRLWPTPVCSSLSPASATGALRKVRFLPTSFSSRTPFAPGETGIQVSAYFFSQALTEDEAREEAQFALDNLHETEAAGATFSYVAYDHEPVKIEGARANNLSSEQLTANARAFCEAIAAAGYAPMLYGNQRDLLRLAPELRAAYPVWLAEYDVEAPTAPLDFAIWQYTNAGTVPGIPTDVDLNVWLEPQK